MDTNFNDRINILQRRLYYISDKNQLQIRINYLKFVISLLNNNFNQQFDINLLNKINNIISFLKRIIVDLSISKNQQLLYNNLKSIYNTNLNKYNGMIKMYNMVAMTELDLLYKFYSNPLTPETSIDNKSKVNIIKFILDYLNKYSNYDLNQVDPVDFFAKYYYINIKNYIKDMNEETFYIILNSVIKNQLPQLENNLNLLSFQLQNYPISNIKFEFENLLTLYTNPKLLLELQKNIKNEIDKEIKLNYLNYQSKECLNNNCFNLFLKNFINNFVNNEKLKNNMITIFNKSKLKNPSYIFKFSDSKIMNSISSKCQNCLLLDIQIIWYKDQKNIQMLEIENNMVVNKSTINTNISTINMDIINNIINTIYTYLITKLPQKVITNTQESSSQSLPLVNSPNSLELKPVLTMSDLIKIPY